MEYVLPFLLCIFLIPFIHNNYGVAGVWCFIREVNDDCTSNRDGIIEILNFALFYSPIVVSLILSVLAIVIMIVVMVRRAYVNSNTTRE